MDTFLGFITAFPWAWPPLNFSTCQGQVLQVNSNAALYSLLGNTFGGTASSTFGLPDLRGKHIVGQGQNPITGTTYAFGGTGGSEKVTLTSAQCVLAAHTHPASMTLSGLSANTSISVSSTTTSGQVSVPAAGSTLTNSPTGAPTAANIYLPQGTPQNAPVNLGGVTTTVSGSGTVAVGANTPVPAAAAVDLRNPYLVLNFCIALQGIYPSRN